MKLEVRQSSSENSFKSSTGILQGECTSPIFFSFFVNDLENVFDSDDIGTECYDILLKLLMYADDMVIFSDTEEGLQEALNNLDVYCSKWDISVNTVKTKVVVFQKSSCGKCSTNFVYRNKVLEIVPFFKFLGLYLKNNGSFALHFKEIIKSARKALFSLKKTLQTNPEIVPTMQLDLFNSMVLPILFYGCEVWGFCQADPLERFYISFLKNVLCVKQSTPNCFVYGEFGLFPLILGRKLRIIKYWFKILNSSNDSFIKKMYNDLLVLSERFPDQITWVTLLRDMLFNYGFAYVWYDQYVFNETTFLRMFEQRMKDTYIQEWNSKVRSTSDYRLYKKIKFTFNFENYLNMDNKSFRISITKIRLSSHLFYIERGRWEKQKIEAIDRKCVFL